MSERIQTPINGITTTSNYTEGDTYSLVNLRPQYGALHPVSPRKVVQELSQKYDIVFVHQNNDYKNWIGIINEKKYSSVYWDVRDEEPQSIASYISGKINSVQQIGNTISLITEDNIFYLFYQNGKYTFLGEIPDIPVISFGSSEPDYIITKTLKYTDEYDSITIDKDNFAEYTEGLVNKVISDINQDEYYLFDAVLVRYAFRLYDGTLVKHSPPILVCFTINTMPTKMIYYRINGTSFQTSNSSVTVSAYKMSMSYDFSQMTGWDEIIQSVDLFMSAPIGLTSLNKEKLNSLYRDTNGQHTETSLLELNSKYFSNIESEGNFYFVKELKIGTQSDDLIFPSSSDSYKGTDYLLQQERMTDDNFSHHRYGAASSYTYNSRLHLGNVNTTFFHGFNSSYFNWISERYNGYKNTDPNASKYKEIIVEVEINTGNRIDKLYSTVQYPNAKALFWSPFISYPDTRAKRMIIYGVLVDDTVVQIQSFTLKLHASLNLAYYLNITFASSSFSDFIYPIIENKTIIPSRPDTDSEVVLSEPNKIKVSELNNPLNFPNTNVYQAGNGTILAMATNAMLVSDRNFGQYPLYVFTTQGIWTLNVGSGEVVYSTQSAPTYTEAPTTSIVCSVPFGVVFTTQRGLMVINGQSVDFISPQLEQPPLSLNIETSTHCEGVIHKPEQKKFSELLRGLTNLIYNSYENELIVNTPHSELNYVLNFNNQSFYQSTEKIGLVVGNVFPELFVVNNKTLKDYASAEQADTHVSFILRPLTYGTPDIKRLERMILRGLFYNVQKPSDGKFSLIMSHASNDNVNFQALRGLPVEEGNLRDKDMGLFASSKFRNYLFIFAGRLDSNSQIQFLETAIDKEYNNTKMR